MMIEVLIHSGESRVERWVSHAGAVYSVYCLMSKCLRVGVLNLFRVVGPCEMRVEAMNPFTTLIHKHLPAFSGHLRPQGSSSVTPRLRTPT